MAINETVTSVDTVRCTVNPARDHPGRAAANPAKWVFRNAFALAITSRGVFAA
ncbi:MAG: hypothetical protein ACOC8J_04635 [Ralstonia sp.]|jgi:hypothetical protein